ncbi:hypothetical protein V6N13_075168 [Hibiscus sabdariffa]|uniref:WAT1-related protein n=1 Tax=Hibiscus sabdariffa TaxID=183260 RepID=A0ABR2UAU4_9ROSI
MIKEFPGCNAGPSKAISGCDFPVVRVVGDVFNYQVCLNQHVLVVYRHAIAHRPTMNQNLHYTATFSSAMAHGQCCSCICIFACLDLQVIEFDPCCSCPGPNRITYTNIRLKGVVCSGIGYYVQGVIMKTRGPVFVTAFNPLSMVIVAILSCALLRMTKDQEPSDEKFEMSASNDGGCHGQTIRRPFLLLSNPFDNHN